MILLGIFGFYFSCCEMRHTNLKYSKYKAGWAENLDTTQTASVDTSGKTDYF